MLYRCVLAIAVLAAAACGGQGSGDGGGGSGSSGPDGNGDDPFGNAEAGAGPDIDFTDVDQTSNMNDDDELTDENACAASSVAAEEIVVEEEVEVEVEVEREVEVEVEVEVEIEVKEPVAMYVLFDRSLSMGPGYGDLWDPAVSAFSSFVQSDDSEDIDIALQYFPIDDGECNGGGYDTPAVALGRLPGNAQAIVDSLDGESPDGFGTPIEGALNGGAEYCKAFQQANADEKCVVVLVTDGEPLFGCSEDDDQLAGIAEDAWDNHEVQTFAVGLEGADFDLLDQIAMVGGAIDCDPDSDRFSCDISGGAGQLASVLAQIRDTIVTTETQTQTETQTVIETEIETQIQTTTQEVPLECEWGMPEPEDGAEIDPDKVNVQLSGGEDGPVALGRVQGEDTCAEMGWYYDDNEEPTRILACPQTCDAIDSQGHTSVDILLGCATMEIVIE